MNKTDIKQLNIRGIDSFKLESNYLYPLTFSIDDDIFIHEEA